MGEHKEYPTRIPVWSCIFRTLGAIALIGYGIYGLFSDDLVIPTKRSLIHLHGFTNWVMVCALLCAACATMASVIAYYCRCENTPAYKAVVKWSPRLGYIFCGAAIGLHFAGMQYPNPSHFSGFSAALGFFTFCLFLFLAFNHQKFKTYARKQESVSGARASVPPTTNLGRVLGIIMVLFGAPLLLVSLLAMVKLNFMATIVASVAILLLTFGVFSFRRTPLAVPDVATASNELPNKWVKTPGNTPSAASRWLPLRIAVLLVAGLWAIWYVRVEGLGASRWINDDELERQHAPAWTHRMDDLRFGLSVSEIQAKLTAEGFKAKCYKAREAKDKITPTDTDVCFTIINNIEGIPARMVVFHFGDDGLRHVMLDFPKEQWPAVSQWFNRQGVDAGNFGRDYDQSQIIGRRGKTGLLMTSKPLVERWIMVTWEARERVFDDQCKAKLTMEQQKLLCQDWPQSSNIKQF